MTEILIGIAVGLVGSLILWLLLRRRGEPTTRIDIRHSIMQLRAVGELVVFKLISQQIVTKEEHAAGRWSDLFKWALSSKKLAVIIEYGIDFKFNLRDSAFQISEEGEGRFRFTMPPCQCQTYVRDIRFYDEQNARLLPWLLGNITEVLGPGFSETDKNRLLEAARHEADAKAQQMVEQLQSEVRTSARQTLESLARGFGAEHVTIDFAEKQLEAEPAKLEMKQPAATS